MVVVGIVVFLPLLPLYQNMIMYMNANLLNEYHKRKEVRPKYFSEKNGFRYHKIKTTKKKNKGIFK